MATISKAMQKSEQEHGNKPAESAVVTASVHAASAGAAVVPPPATLEPAPFIRHSVGSDGLSPLLVVHKDRGGRIAEQFRSLGTNLLARTRDEKLHSIITSACHGEGKTVTVLNLALALAERPERRVLVIDADLRHGRAAEMLGVKAAHGLADCLRIRAPIEELLRTTSQPNLTLLPAGRASRDEIGALLGRPHMASVFRELAEAYECILVDTPPLLVASDAAVIGRAVGDALLVVRLNKTCRDAVSRTMALLRSANVRVGGMILTDKSGGCRGQTHDYA